MHRVVAVRALAPFKVWLRFNDQREGVVDLAEIFSQGGVFTPLRDPAAFAQVKLDREFGAIEWPGSVDLDPDALYAALTSQATQGGPEASHPTS